MKRAFLVVTASVALAAAGDGIRPRGSSADYAAHITTTGVSIGAAVVPADQVRKLFRTDLNHAGYVVVEIGVFPESGQELKVAQNDFMLRAGAEGNVVRAATGETIAAVISDKYAPKEPKQIGGRGVDVYPTANIGYESGTDPYSGRRVGGVYGGAGVGVGVGGGSGPDPRDPSDPVPSARAQRSAAEMQEELENKALPEGRTTEAVAGYVYFPRPSKKKNEPLSLTWYGPQGSPVRLTLATSK